MTGRDHCPQCGYGYAIFPKYGDDDLDWQHRLHCRGCGHPLIWVSSAFNGQLCLKCRYTNPEDTMTHLPPHSFGVRFVTGRPLPDPNYDYDNYTGNGQYRPGTTAACCDWHRARVNAAGRIVRTDTR